MSVLPHTARMGPLGCEELEETKSQFESDGDVNYPGWEDPLEKGMTTYSNILACRTPWTEEPGGLQSMGSQRVGHN